MAERSATPEDLRDELLAAMPPGFDDLMDLEDPDGPGPLFSALGQVLCERGTDQVDALRLELCPTTCSAATLAEWEGALALDTTRIALSGAVAERRAQVLSRLREWGAPTLDLIRRVVYSYLGYASPSDVVILESPRDAIRAMHTYPWRRGLSATCTLSFRVKDGGTVAPGGAVVDLSIAVSDLSQVVVELEGPDGTLAQRLKIGAPVAQAAGRTWSEMPTPGGDELFCVWGVSTLSGAVAWAVGDGGTILTFDGATWSAASSPTATTLYGVWGTSASSVWAVGEAGEIWKWNGSTWTAQTSGTAEDLYGVWGTSASNVWAVGTTGTILHFDGTSWSAATNPTTESLHSVWGTSTADAWAVGEGGRILHWNGTAWASVASGVSTTLHSVWGSSAWDVYACGASGVLLHYDAYGAFRPVATGTSAALYAGCLGEVLEDGSAWPCSTAWIVGAGEAYFFDGQVISESYPNAGGSDMNGLWRRSASDFFAAGGASAQVQRMADSGARVRVWFPEFAGAQVDGKWDVTVSGGSAWITDGDLFVEGIGLDARGVDGRGAAALQWGVMFEEEKVVGAYDLHQARIAIRRLTYGGRWSNILRRSSGAGALPSGDYGTIPGDLGSLPAAAVPG